MRFRTTAAEVPTASMITGTSRTGHLGSKTASHRGLRRFPIAAWQASRVCLDWLVRAIRWDQFVDYDLKFKFNGGPLDGNSRIAGEPADEILIPLEENATRKIAIYRRRLRGQAGLNVNYDFVELQQVPSAHKSA